MVEFKINISNPKTGKSVQKVMQEAKSLTGIKIGDKVKGEVIGLTGMEFELTGGSDNSGFPMRSDVHGALRKRVLIVGGIGLRKNRKGTKRRRAVAGRKVSSTTAQLNLKITSGFEKFEGLIKKEETPKEEKKEAAPKEEVKKEAAPKEEKKEEAPKAEAAPKEEKKEEGKKE